MSRTVNRGTCSTRPGNEDLSQELYPIYHAFTSPSNLSKVMMDLANEHPEMSRFDGMLMRTLAEKTYTGSNHAQAAEGRVRKDLSLLQGEVNALNALYKWPLLQQMAADWAPDVRHHFLYKEGELLGSRPIYGSGGDAPLSENLIRSRLGMMTDQRRCVAAEVPLDRWPAQDPPGAPPTFARPNPLPLLPNRPDPQLGTRAGAPGAIRRGPSDSGATTQRVVPGMAAVQLCTHGQCVR